ncbi:hypothetical protein KR044_001225 [Drosophila immigrans]|nr:hypothetical protein KR044_001225 [Drosophila immigrans]
MSLTKKDPSLRVAASDPHLVSLGGGRLSTAVTIHYIHIGDTTIGSAPSCSISLNGSGVRPLHCTIYRSEGNEVTLVPEPGARLLIDGAHIEREEEVKLSQGAMITIGNSNYLRFNNPDEAQMMRSAMGSNERISMPHIDFTQQSAQSCHEARELETFYETIINPFKSNDLDLEVEMERINSLQQHGGVQCPKVFSSDLVTVNMPARDVLGQKYASFARNLAENHRSDKQLNNQYAKNALPAGIGNSSGYCNVPSNAAIYRQQQQQQQHHQQSLQQQQQQQTELLSKVNNVHNAGYDRYPKPGTYTAGGLQIYAMNGINTELNSGVELEDMLKICTEYADRQQEQQREREREREHNSSSCSNSNSNHGNANGSSITSSPIVQNRIKTNGSLPRDKKSPFQQHAAGSNSNLALVSSSSGYENVRLLAPNRVEINGQLHVANSSVVTSTAATVAATTTTTESQKYVPQSPRTKIRTNCMSPKKDVSFGNAFVAASTPIAVVKPPLAPKPPPPNQQRDYEQLFKSFERKQQLELQQEQRQLPPQLTPAKRTNKNINNLTLKLNEPTATLVATTSSPKPSRKPAPAPRSINVEQRQRRELLQRRKQLKRELAELPPTEHIELEPSDQLRPSTPRQQLQALQNRIHRLEAQRNATRVMEENQQAKLKQSIEMKQDQLNKLRAMLKQKPNNACLKEELEHVCESLDSDRKIFEDLEFQYFEEESEHHASHEELKRQEQRLTLESELASLRIQLGPDEAHEESATTTPAHSGRSSPVAVACTTTNNSSNLVNGVMSQSLFGSAELLCPKRRIDDDLMSKSVNENMFYNNNKIELPHGDHNKVTTSTPKRPPLQIYDDLTGSCEQISFNLSLRSDRFEVNPLERRVPSQDDIDRSCKVANDAPISTSQGASTKIFDSIKEIERNRKLLLAQQGHQVIEHERQKIYDLKKKSHDEARTQYLRSTQQTTAAPQSPQLPHAPLNANGGKDAKLFEKTELQKLNEKEAINASADGSPLTTITTTTAKSTTTPATNNAGQQQQRHSQPELEHHGIVGVVAPTARSPRPLSEANNCDAAIEAPKFANDAAATQHQQLQQQQQGENNKRASSNSNSQDTASAGSGSSSGAGTGSSSTASVNAANANGDRKRALAKHQRPLTRYLPIFSPDLNLRHHIETAGHQIDLCPHVFVDAQSCRGYLHKLGATFHAWSRRWFVLDRQRSALIYYSDKSERKPRGGAYFAVIKYLHLSINKFVLIKCTPQTIDEVYLDHLNASKSGRPHCTFIVKTKKRSYNLQAASDAAARIWIDAIITGAQGNLDY